MRLNEAGGSDLKTITHDDSRSQRMALAAQQGDVQAAAWLYRHYRGRVLALMRRIVGPQDAEDLSQQCFLTLLRRIGGFAGKSSFWTWFYRLSVNEALQHLRAEHKRPIPSGAVENVCAPQPQSWEDGEAIEQALNRLPDSQRLTVKLHFHDGLSYKAISDQLSIPMGTVGSRINQAKSYMAKTLTVHPPAAPPQVASRRAA